MTAESFPHPSLRPIQLQIGTQKIAGYESPGMGRPMLLVHGSQDRDVPFKDLTIGTQRPGG